MRDRGAWNDLFRSGDILYGRGAACHWSEATRKTNRKHYAQFLAWLRANDNLSPNAAPSDRVTWENVEAYARSLMARVAPRTVASCSIGLKTVIKHMHPERDWDWLNDLTNRLNCWADQAQTKRKPQAPSAGQVWRIGLNALAQTERSNRVCNAAALEYRDTLMIVLLCAVPIRLRNLAMMRIGLHLDREGEAMFLRFGGNETKNGRPIDMPIPEELWPAFDHYLKHVRPRINGAGLSDRVWIGNKGAPLSENTIYQRICARTEDLFGVPLGPHRFREIVATLLAESSVSDALQARPLLGHVAMGTTERHYIRASQIEASRVVQSALYSVRRWRE